MFACRRGCLSLAKRVLEAVPAPHREYVIETRSKSPGEHPQLSTAMTPLFTSVNYDDVEMARWVSNPPIISFLDSPRLKTFLGQNSCSITGPRRTSPTRSME